MWQLLNFPLAEYQQTYKSLTFIDIMRYLKVYRKQLFVLIIIVVLVYISSVSRNKMAGNVTAVAAGIVMIYAAISFVIWIIKTPTKNDNNQII